MILLLFVPKRDCHVVRGAFCHRYILIEENLRYFDLHASPPAVIIDAIIERSAVVYASWTGNNVMRADNGMAQRA